MAIIMYCTFESCACGLAGRIHTVCAYVLCVCVCVCVVCVCVRSCTCGNCFVQAMQEDRSDEWFAMICQETVKDES